MLGAIAGDIIGSPYEWTDSPDRYFELCRSQKGWFRGREVSYHPRFTDETVMTLAVARWLMQDDTRSSSKLAQTMLQMYQRHQDKGFPPHIRKWAGSSSLAPSNRDSTAEAARVSPIGLKEPHLHDAIRLARQSASITTTHQDSIKAAEAMVQAVWMARHGRSKDDIRYAMEHDFGYDLARDPGVIRQLLDGFEPEPITVNGEDTGQCFYRDTGRMSSSSSLAVCAAVSVFLESDGFEDAIRRGVAIGGHSDTIGSLVGAISEPFYGGVPEKITGLCEKFLDAELSRTMSSFESIGARKGRINGHLDKVQDDSLRVIRCGDSRRIFVVPSERKDIIDAVRKKFGQDAEIIRPHMVSGTLETLSEQGKTGTYLESPRPDMRTIHFQGGEFRNSVTMEGASLPPKEDRRESRIQFLSISDHAQSVKDHLQQEVGYHGEGSIHFANAYYPEIFHDRVEIWRGDLFAGAVGIDGSSGLLRIYQGSDLGLDEYGIGRTENVFNSLDPDSIKESISRFCLDHGIGIFDKDRTLNLKTANDDIARSSDRSLIDSISESATSRQPSHKKL